MGRLEFKTAFKYPFNRAKGLWNILLIFLPIVGWFVLGGYSIRIIKEFIKGEFEQLPTLKFGDDFGLGFFMFLKAIPFMLVYIPVVIILVRINPWLRLAIIPFEILLIPVLTINFMNKETVGSFFEFSVLKPVFNNFGDYIVAFLKNSLLALIFIIMSLVLIGIPAGAFTKSIFLADFYRRRIK